MRIIIQGKQGEGKTTLGLAIKDLLLKQGLNVSYEDNMPCTDMVLKNLKSQFQDRNITIRTEQSQ